MRNVAKTTIGLIIVTIMSKFLGFGRELVLGAIYGASAYSDVYITSMNIPSVLFAAIGTAIGTTFIPLYYEKYNNGGERDSLKFTNNIINVALIISLVLSIISFVFVEPIVKMFAIGFEGDILNIAIRFTKIMIFGGIFIILSNIMTSFLQSKESFIIPGFSGIPFNIIIIISIMISANKKIYILPIGTLIAMLSQFLFIYFFSYKKGYRYKRNLDFTDEHVKKLIWLVWPVLIGVGVNQINTMIDRTLASTLVEGSISALNYANRLNSFVMALFITSIGAVIYPMLSKLSLSYSKEKFLGTIVKSINIVFIIIIPISVGAIILSKPIVTLLFQRGAFDERATSMTSAALIFYSIGMIGFGLRDIFGKIFYSLQDTKTPMINGIISIGINIILNFILVKIMGHVGLAFATSISALICILLLFNSLNKKIGYFGQDKIVKTFCKVIVASISMSIITIFMHKLLCNGLGIGFIAQATSLLGAVTIGAIVYGIVLMILKVDEISMITDIVSKKVSKPNSLRSLAKTRYESENERLSSENETEEIVK